VKASYGNRCETIDKAAGYHGNKTQSVSLQFWAQPVYYYRRVQICWEMARNFLHRINIFSYNWTETEPSTDKIAIIITEKGTEKTKVEPIVTCLRHTGLWLESWQLGPREINLLYICSFKVYLQKLDVSSSDCRALSVKEFGIKRSEPNFDSYHCICEEGLRKTSNTSVKVAAPCSRSEPRSCWVETRVMTPMQRQPWLHSVVWIRKRTIPTKQPPLVGEDSANFCG
jgi:hypothetical protein